MQGETQRTLPPDSILAHYPSPGPSSLFFTIRQSAQGPLQGDWSEGQGACLGGRSRTAEGEAQMRPSRPVPMV